MAEGSGFFGVYLTVNFASIFCVSFQDFLGCIRPFRIFVSLPLTNTIMSPSFTLRRPLYIYPTLPCEDFLDIHTVARTVVQNLMEFISFCFLPISVQSPPFPRAKTDAKTKG